MDLVLQGGRKIMNHTILPILNKCTVLKTVGMQIMHFRAVQFNLHDDVCKYNLKIYLEPSYFLQNRDDPK